MNRPPQASLSTTNSPKRATKASVQVGGPYDLTDAKDKDWIGDVDDDIERRGTEGKCTPITKPGCTGRAKALAKTFKKMAKKRKAKNEAFEPLAKPRGTSKRVRKDTASHLAKPNKPLNPTQATNVAHNKNAPVDAQMSGAEQM